MAESRDVLAVQFRERLRVCNIEMIRSGRNDWWSNSRRVQFDEIWTTPQHARAAYFLLTITS
ncbi:hypothetical protein [Burkholderia sp. Z1]|uniref:hypothetical protein n=1 Tax=Burkholderia sp. Z1 TaxID=2759039 RepID=UPI001865C42D|nr:hypothetical protein [Burkholderia sp. Z1]